MYFSAFQQSLLGEGRNAKQKEGGDSGLSWSKTKQELIGRNDLTWPIRVQAGVLICASIMHIIGFLYQTFGCGVATGEDIFFFFPTLLMGKRRVSLWQNAPGNSHTSPHALAGSQLAALGYCHPWCQPVNTPALLSTFPYKASTLSKV